MGAKYEVRLADFDSLQETRAARAARDMPSVECKVRPDPRVVMGTVGYRAPEVSVQLLCSYDSKVNMWYRVEKIKTQRVAIKCM